MNQAAHDLPEDMRNLAILTGARKLDYWAIECVMCGKVTTNGQCGCPAPAMRPLNIPKQDARS